MIFQTIILVSLTLFSPSALAQEIIDEMLAIVERNVITQSDLQSLTLLNQYHIPDTTFLYERSGQAPMMYLVELEILYNLASSVPIYKISTEKELYAEKLLKKIYTENPLFPFRERIYHWLKLQLIAENYVRINLGLSNTHSVSISAYIRWMEKQKERVAYRIIPPRKP